MNPFLLRKKHENEKGRMKTVNEMVFEKVEEKNGLCLRNKVSQKLEKKFIRQKESHD